VTRPDLDGFDAVVYDLDGTLARLVVDWDAAADDVLDVFAAAGVDPGTADLWELLDAADEAGLRDGVEAVLADHECAGARRSERLALADDAADRAGPLGVCSLNCERACRVALERHGLGDRMGAVVGRDSVETRKPDPAPLVATLDALGVAADRAVFVGDSERDAVAADRAGVAFRWADPDG
jgi:phosphoglycolate phosphatase